MKLVIFDCDGTLVDSQHAIVAAMTAAFATEGLIAPPRDSIVGVVGLSLAIAVARLVPEGSDLDLVDRLAEAYKAAFSDLRARPGHAEPLYAGVRDMIGRLSARSDVVLGIATGKSRRGVDVLLDREGLTGVFSTVQTADTNPSKPHPGMLLSAMDETGVAGADTVMIGDTVFDIEMAHAAGVTAIGVAWGYHDADDLRAAGAAFVAEDSADLDRLLSAFLSARVAS